MISGRYHPVAIVGIAALVAATLMTTSATAMSRSDGVLDSVTTRAGAVRGELEDFVSQAPAVIREYKACVNKAHKTPQPYKLQCGPLGYSGPTYGFTNLLAYVDMGERAALAVAKGSCRAALRASTRKGVSAADVAAAVGKLDDAFQVGYPRIDARLKTAVAAINGKVNATRAVLNAC